jgi:hypothetical protein
MSDPKKPPPKPTSLAGSVPRPAASRAAAHGTGDSAFELPPVGAKSASSFSQLPRVASGPSTSSSQLPRVATSPGGIPVSSSHNNLAAVGGPVPVLTQGMPKKRKTNVIQKQLASSGFDQQETTQTEVLMGRAKSVELDHDEEDSLSGQFYDGETAAKEVSTKTTWRALKAPVRSRSLKRSPRVLWTVIDQFAVGSNPRYVPAKPDDLRAHIFAWDVSMAMECEIPHYKVGREMTCMTTIDWVRFKATESGWKRVDEAGALAAADRGELVLAISKDPKARALVVVRPGGAGEDGRPRVASAGVPKGNDLGVTEAVGAEVQYYAHP